MLRRGPARRTVGWLDVAGQTAELLGRARNEQSPCLANREHWRSVLTKKDVLELTERCRGNLNRERAVALVSVMDALLEEFDAITEKSISDTDLHRWFVANGDTTPGGTEMVAFSTTGWFGATGRPAREIDTLTLCLQTLLARGVGSKHHGFKVVRAPRWVWSWFSQRPLPAGMSSDWAHLTVGPACQATASELELAIPLWRPGVPGPYETLEHTVVAARKLEELSRSSRASV